LERAAGRWRVTATERGNLDAAMLAAGHTRAEQPGSEDPSTLQAALDVDIGGCPLTNTLPIRRLGLLEAIMSPARGAGRPVGAQRTIDVAWVLVPSLEVVVSTQGYQPLGDGALRFTSGEFSAEIRVDDRGYVRHYPGLAERA
jgi:hypothetical protein